MASFCVASVFLHLIRRRGERKAMVSPHQHAHYIAAQKLEGRPLPVIARYALVTLIPALLIALGATVWGFAGALALIWLTLIAAGLDHLLAPPQPADADHGP